MKTTNPVVAGKFISAEMLIAGGLHMIKIKGSLLMTIFSVCFCVFPWPFTGFYF